MPAPPSFDVPKESERIATTKDIHQETPEILPFIPAETPGQTRPQPICSEQILTVAKNLTPCGEFMKSGSGQANTVDSLLRELNDSQRHAATAPATHTLVLAGAGCGKTKTIIARAAYLISSGTRPERIQILTFTRRSASEIVERVRLTIGDSSKGLRASTFHTWCTSLLHRNPIAFGFKSFTIIDRDDQLQLFRILRGKKAKAQFLTAAELCDLYSYARNTRSSLDKALLKKFPNFHPQKEHIATVMKHYEERKRARNYFDYDDILDIVARGIAQYPDVCAWIGSQYDHILVDEMQDTNPIQWELLQPLTNFAKLFCVGDDAQSIYGFRGADFRNVHSFKERVPGALVLKLEDNYRSTQEILNISNWLLSRSEVPYGKRLRAIRGDGVIPKIHTFSCEWEEGRWIAEDLEKRKADGSTWSRHMILVRSSFIARTVEAALLAKEIPYIFIGGTKLLEAAHVKDVLSALRVTANHQDEIGWMRYLILWNGLGEVTAAKIANEILQHSDLDETLRHLAMQQKIPPLLIEIIKTIQKLDGQIPEIIKTVAAMMNNILSEKYKNQDWEKRRRDFDFVAKLAKKHRSILEFIEEYVLDPAYSSELSRKQNEDVVQIITIHSAKGTEREVCYIQNVSAGQYPSTFSIGNLDDIEEERRVLYVALTRAKDELIITRRNRITSTTQSHKKLNKQATCQGILEIQESIQEPTNQTNENTEQLIESYFLNELPNELVEENVHTKNKPKIVEYAGSLGNEITFGIDLS